MTRLRRDQGWSSQWPLAAPALLALGFVTSCRSEPAPLTGHPEPAGSVGHREPSPLPERIPGIAAPETEPIHSADWPKLAPTPSAEPPPLPLREDQALEADPLVRETSNPPREPTPGVVLEADWRTGDPLGPAPVAELSAEGLNDARNTTRASLRIELGAPGRARWVFVGRGHALLENSELRSRRDRLGHLLFWPDGQRYRVARHGTLRSLWLDRRLDAGSSFTVPAKLLSPGGLLGHGTQRIEVQTPLGTLQLEQAVLAGSSGAGVLVCRTLVELVGAEPSPTICPDDLTPLRAQLTSGGGRVTFTVLRVTRRLEPSAASLATPPVEAHFVATGLPSQHGPTLSPTQLTALRTRATSQSTTPAGAPRTGLVAVNRSLGLRGLWLDGVALAWLDPGEEVAVPELRMASYSLVWRDAFGALVEPIRLQPIPARVVHGKPTEPSGS